MWKDRFIQTLRVLHLTYIALLPPVAIVGIRISNNIPDGTYSFLGNIGIFIMGILMIFAAVFYLGIALALAPFPKNIPGALLITFAIPLQIALATFLANQSIWSFFLISLLTEGIGIAWLMGAMIKEKQAAEHIWETEGIFIAVIATAFVFIALPILRVLFQDNLFSWLIFFLGSISSALAYNRSFKAGNIDNEGTVFVIIGILAWFFAPALPALTAYFFG